MLLTWWTRRWSEFWDALSAVGPSSSGKEGGQKKVYFLDPIAALAHVGSNFKWKGGGATVMTQCLGTGVLRGDDGIG